MANNNKHHVYILISSDQRFYTGYTIDLEKRLRQHQSGIGSKFTRAFGAEAIVYHESFTTKSEALKREAAIKKMSRAQKSALIHKKGPEVNPRAF